MDSFVPIAYKQQFEARLLSFLEICLPESGRELDINGRHRFYLDIPAGFRGFWCMFDENAMIGTVGVRNLGDKCCELKSLYLLEKYHGMGYGRKLLETAMDFARICGFQKMYLDSLSTSTKALTLYRKAGFQDTERYHDAVRADIFMVKDL